MTEIMVDVMEDVVWPNTEVLGQRSTDLCERLISSGSIRLLEETMPQRKIDSLIVNSPYEEPRNYWNYDRQARGFDLVAGRRPAGYVVASSDSKSFDDPGVFVEIPLVNKIRTRVDAWRNGGYSGVTGITKRLIEYWRDSEEHDVRRL